MDTKQPNATPYVDITPDYAKPTTDLGAALKAGVDAYRPFDTPPSQLPGVGPQPTQP